MGVQRTRAAEQASRFICPALRRNRPRAGAIAKSKAKALPRGSETVLLVEDEKGVRELAREYLEMTGYTVIEAENGHTALELAAMHVGPIHLLMTDVVMPGISGRELAGRVKTIRPEIKVLFMSGYTDQAVVHHGILETDAVAFAEAVHDGGACSEAARDSQYRNGAVGAAVPFFTQLLPSS